MNAASNQTDYSGLAEMALNAIGDGVIMIDEAGVIKFANPAAARMTGYGDPSNLVGLSYQLVMKLETLDGATVEEASRRSGFSSVQYFCRVFRKHTGVSPGSFRAAPFSHP